MTLDAPVRPVGVEELKRAWRAVQAGDFRTGHRPEPPAASRGRVTRAAAWEPGERVLPVLGCQPQAGTSALALGIATVAGEARVVECCSAEASGLNAAATAELGVTAGWALGRRDGVHLVRTTGVHLAADELPPPLGPPPGTDLTVLDVGWDTAHVLVTSGWLADELTGTGVVVVVAIATVPGLRRLETTLTLLDRASAVVAVRGVARRRWPAWLAAELGPTARRLEAADRLVAVPHDKHLSGWGVTTDPLPAPLLTAAEAVWRRTGTTTRTQERTS